MLTSLPPVPRRLTVTRSSDIMDDQGRAGLHGHIHWNVVPGPGWPSCTSGSAQAEAASSSLPVTNMYPASIMDPTSRSSCCMRVAFGCGPPSWASTMLPGEARCRVSSTSAFGVTAGDPGRPQHDRVVQPRALGQPNAVDAAVRRPAQGRSPARSAWSAARGCAQAGPVEGLVVLGQIAVGPGVVGQLRDPRPRPGRPRRDRPSPARRPGRKWPWRRAAAGSGEPAASTAWVGPSSMVRATSRLGRCGPERHRRLVCLRARRACHSRRRALGDRGRFGA